MLSFKRHGQYIIYDIMAFLYSNNYKKKKKRENATIFSVSVDVFVIY